MTAGVQAALSSVDFLDLDLDLDGGARVRTRARGADDLEDSVSGRPEPSTGEPSSGEPSTGESSPAKRSAAEPIFVLCDGDLGESARELTALVDAVRRGDADMAVAAFATRVGGGFGLALTFARWAIRRRCGLSTRAPISGQRAVRAGVMRDLLPFAGGFGMEVGMTIDAVRAGYRVVEIEHRSGPPRHRPHPCRVCASGPSAPRCRARVLLPAVGSRRDDPRDRPGNHRHHLLRVRRGLRADRARLPRVRQHFPQPGWVEHDPGESVERHPRGGRRGARGRRRSPGRAAGGRDRQPARDRLRLGSGRPASRCTVRSSGRTAAPRRCASSCAPRATSRSCARAPASCSTRTSPPPRSRGCSTTSPACASGRGTGRAVFGTIDSWLIFKLTGEHVTDASNASRTLLYDIAAGRWDPELLDLFDIPARALGEVRPSAGVFAKTLPDALHGHAVPLAGVAGDQQAALFGQACVDPGMGKNTYGTGSFVLLNIGFHRARAAARPARDRGLDDRLHPPRMRWRPRSSSPAPPCSGCATAWQSSSARPTPRRWPRRLQSNDGVYFVPALTGLGSPHWDPHARGTIVGLTRGATARAPGARDARGDRLPDLDAVRAMELASGQAIRRAACRWRRRAPNGWLMQFQADILGVPVVLGARDLRDDRARRRLPGRRRRGLWTVSDVACLVARARALRAAHGRRGARRAARRLGRRAGLRA